MLLLFFKESSPVVSERKQVWCHGEFCEFGPLSSVFQVLSSGPLKSKLRQSPPCKITKPQLIATLYILERKTTYLGLGLETSLAIFRQHPMGFPYLQSRKHTQESSPAEKTTIRVKMSGMYQALDAYVLTAVYTMVRPFLCWEMLFRSKQCINVCFLRASICTE